VHLITSVSCSIVEQNWTCYRQSYHTVYVVTTKPETWCVVFPITVVERVICNREVKGQGHQASRSSLGTICTTTDELWHTVFEPVANLSVRWWRTAEECISLYTSDSIRFVRDSSEIILILYESFRMHWSGLNNRRIQHKQYNVDIHLYSASDNK